MELFDVVDENDKVIGQATSKECHSNPKLIHRVVHFSLVDLEKQTILITKRAEGLKYDGGKVCFPGEHMLTGETYIQAASRGIAEELGVTPKKVEEINSHIFYQPTQTEFARFFIGYGNNEPVTFATDEIQSVEWLDLSLLRDRKHEYSEMTKYWVENTDWNKIFRNK